MKKNEEDNSGRKKKVEVLRRSSWVDAVEHVPVSQEQKKMLLWTFFASDLPNDAESLQRNFVHHVEYSLALTHQQLEQLPFASFQAAALVLRDRILGNWKETESFWRHSDAKTVNFFSIEYLLGRSLQSVATNLKLTKRLSKALGSLGISLEEIVEEEQDAGLGNGGLGRLAACFMDSLATLDYPAWAYGLLYSYGMFRQAFGTSGEQIEMPDHWLPSVWVVPRLDVVYPVRFGGTARDLGQGRFSWEGGDIVLAVANDIPIPGFMTPNALSIRLWSSKPCCEFQLQSFNTSGDYGAAIAAKQQSESLTAVLYPSDSSLLGKELRLKQEYFFVAASTKDIWMRFKKRNKRLGEFPQCNAIQLNDSHPALAVAELMRILIDEEGLAWSEAWGIATSTFSYTNHTILPEALETWPVDMLHRLLPRHLKIIFDINFFFLRSVELRWPGNLQKLVSMSIIEEGFPRRVRMSHLAIIGSHAVNGVARLHTDILKSRVFPDFGEFWPEKFINITNGVSPRRWLLVANPPLADLITTTLQVERQWVSNTRLLRGLESFCDDPLFQLRWADVKRQAKERFARFVAKKLGLRVNCRALFDVQVKRFHEYKRQLLNALGCVWRWLWLRSASPEECANAVPRLVIIGGKAAPGYVEAKLVLKFFNRVMAVVNADPIVAGLLQIVVVPDYNVSLAELIIPASDLSQHISLAGTETPGDRFAFNGGLIVGTWDGATVEIAEEIGPENVFTFGERAENVSAVRAARATKQGERDPRLTAVIDAIRSGTFGPAADFEGILNSLIPANDHWLIGADFGPYLDAQARADETFKDRAKWVRMSILSTARIGRFSSDRSIQQYAEQVWNIVPCRRPGAVPISIERLSTSAGVSGKAAVFSPANLPQY